MIKIDFPPFSKLVNEPFKDLINNDDRYILLWGGRLSGKSVSAMRYLILRALIEPYFKCILVRKVYDTIKDSMYEALLYEIEYMGLSSAFTSKLNPLEIKCLNGSKFIARGLDKADKLKSIKEPSFVWYEEGNQITEDDFITVTTSIRANKARLIQEVFSFNPESTESDYTKFWIYRYFFEGRSGNSFRSELKVKLSDGSESISNYTVIHSTYKDNPHAKKESIATIENLKKTNPFYYRVYALGLWGNKDVKNKAYRTFTEEAIKDTKYDPNKPIYLVFDENSNPYITLLVIQTTIKENTKEIHILENFCLPDPENTVKALCNRFLLKYKGHRSGGIIFGDATSRKQDTKIEKGENFFTLISSYLSEFGFYTDIPKANPSQRQRMLFVNDIFANLTKLRVFIDPNADKLIEDFLNVQEDSDGTKLKRKERDKASGISFERFGHTSDCFEYFVCQHFVNEYEEFKNGGPFDFDFKIKTRNFGNKSNRL